MEKVACGVGAFRDRSWEIYKTKSGRYQLRVRVLIADDVNKAGNVSKEWLEKSDVPEWCKHALWMKSKSLLALV